MPLSIFVSVIVDLHVLILLLLHREFVCLFCRLYHELFSCDMCQVKSNQIYLNQPKRQVYSVSKTVF